MYLSKREWNAIHISKYKYLEEDKLYWVCKDCKRKICHKDIINREISNQAIKRYQLKQAINGYQLNQLDQRSYEPHELKILWYKQRSVLKKLEKLPMICAQFSFVTGYNKHKIGSSLPPRSIEPHDKCKRATECYKDTSEALHDLCTSYNICIRIPSAQNRIITPRKSIETHNKWKWACRKQSLAFATNKWLSNI